MHHFAHFLGHTEILKILIDRGANLNVSTLFDKQFPIHLAADAGHTDAVKILIESGVNVDIRDGSNAYTPLFYASMRVE